MADISPSPSVEGGSGGRVVRALAPSAPRRSLCGVVGSSLGLAALPTTGISVTVFVDVRIASFDKRNKWGIWADNGWKFGQS